MGKLLLGGEGKPTKSTWIRVPNRWNSLTNQVKKRTSPRLWQAKPLRPRMMLAILMMLREQPVPWATPR